jgi:hypothetical protein
MDFSYEVDPDLDLAVGTELSMEEVEGEYEVEDFAAWGIDPLNPTGAKPGSEEKVRMLAARYAAGVPLWHDEDCYDHGPSDVTLTTEEDHLDDEFEPDDL